MSSVNDCCTNDFSVELNLMGHDLDPDRVTSILGLRPVKAGRKGDPRTFSADGGVYDMGFWVHEISSQNEITDCRDHQLTCLADAIMPHVDALESAGVERIYFYYTMSSFIGMLNIKFNAETMAKLGSINADLYVSCYDCFDSKHPFWSFEQETPGKPHTSA